MIYPTGVSVPDNQPMALLLEAARFVFFFTSLSLSYTDVCAIFTMRSWETQNLIIVFIYRFAQTYIYDFSILYTKGMKKCTGRMKTPSR